MRNSCPISSLGASASQPSNQQMTAGALARLLAPLADLAVASGVKLQTLETLLKEELVKSAHRTLKTVSAISLATGVHRPDVTRLIEDAPHSKEQSSAEHSPAIAVFTIWANNPAWQCADGTPMRLQRVTKLDDPAYSISFDALCKSVNKELPAKTILNELERLGLVRTDSRDKTVSLQVENYAPKADQQALLGFMADNVGDHLRAAVGNVLQTSQHFEQAIYSDPLDLTTVKAVEDMARAHWKLLKEQAVPVLTSAEERYLQTISPPEHTLPAQRLRMGMYVYFEPQI